MTTTFYFKDFKVSYDIDSKMYWAGASPWEEDENKRQPSMATYYIEVYVESKQVSMTLFVIFWESKGYEVNPNVDKGSEKIKTLHQRVRLTAKKEIINCKEIYLCQFRIARVKTIDYSNSLQKYKMRRLYRQPMHSNLYNSSIEEIEEYCKIDIKEYLFDKCNALKIGTKGFLTGDTGPRRNALYVSFEKDNIELLVTFFLMTRVYPLL